MNKIYTGDSLEVLRTLPDEIVQCVCTSPPYWGLRDYGVNGQLGLEKTPEEYVSRMVEVFREVRRVLKKDGVLWLNLGDSYSGGKIGRTDLDSKLFSQRNKKFNGKQREITKGFKPKDLVGIPWRVAFALQADGWWLRSDIIWSKPNPMPESVTDRPTKSHEYIFLLTKSAKYYYDADAISEKSEWFEKDARAVNGRTPHKSGKSIQEDSQYAINGVAYNTNGNRNKRSVWSITTQPYSGAHFATFPEEIPTICIKAGSRKGDMVLDPFTGSGTTLEVAKRLDRQYIGIELNEKYVKELIEKRLENVNPLFDSTQETIGV